jgi:DNA-binding transcriptional MocR family regulator
MTELPPFSMVPTEVWADGDLLESDLRVLGALCSFYNAKTGLCFPSHAKIAARTSVSRSTVKNSLRRLRKLGYVSWIRAYAESNGAWLSNRYEITGFDPMDTLEVSTHGQARDDQGGSTTDDHASTGQGNPGMDTPRDGYQQTKEQTTGTDQETDLQTTRKRPFADMRTAEEKQAFYLEQIAREEAAAHA